MYASVVSLGAFHYKARYRLLIRPPSRVSHGTSWRGLRPPPSAAPRLVLIVFFRLSDFPGREKAMLDLYIYVCIHIYIHMCIKPKG